MSEWQGHLLSCPGQLKKCAVHEFFDVTLYVSFVHPFRFQMSMNKQRLTFLCLVLNHQISAMGHDEHEWPDGAFLWAILRYLQKNLFAFLNSHIDCLCIDSVLRNQRQWVWIIYRGRRGDRAVTTANEKHWRGFEAFRKIDPKMTLPSSNYLQEASLGLLSPFTKLM